MSYRTLKKNLKHSCWTERYFSKNFTWCYL